MTFKNNDLISEIARRLQPFSDTAFLDARFFCEQYDTVPDADCIDDFIRRRQLGEPVSKIIGKRGFWKRDFEVSCDVLDPRPDSETIIEAVLKTFPDCSRPYRMLDIGTGSGCLLLTLLDEYPHATGVGVDKSLPALEVARRNNNTARAHFVEADFMNNDFLRDSDLFDVIVSNPPYIRTDEIATLSDTVRLYDPLLALDGGTDGLAAYRQLSRILSRLLCPQGAVFFEIGQGQAADVCALMAENDFSCEQKFKDLSGITRVLMFRKSA